MAGIRKREGGERGEGGRGSEGSEARLEEGKSWRLLLRLDFPVPSPSPGGAQPPALPSRRPRSAAARGDRRGRGGRARAGSPGQPVPAPRPSPPHGSFRTLSVTQAPPGRAAGRRGPPPVPRPLPGPCVPSLSPLCRARLPRATPESSVRGDTDTGLGWAGTAPAFYTQSSHVSCQEKTFVQE